MLLFITGLFGRNNHKWGLSKREQGLTEDDIIPLSFKSIAGYFATLNKADLNKKILDSLDDSEKALLIVTVQRQDKYSLIANFLCSSKSYNMFPICGRILYHHTCTFDDNLSKDPGIFITHLAEEIFSLSPEIGQRMYWNSYVDAFLRGGQCSLFPTKCIEYLVVNPLREYSSHMSSKYYFIVVNFIEDCYSTGVDILRILQILMKSLPSKFKFIYISKFHANKFNGIFPNLRQFYIFSLMTKGVNSDKKGNVEID